MSVESVSSDISILCDCPYAGKTREIKGTGENENKRRRKLKNEIKQTKEDLTIARHVLVDTRRKLAAFQKILSLELGWTINPYIRNESSWKERVREEAYLKFELVRLVDYLRECDHRYVNDPDVYPTKLSTSTEDLLFARQEMKLKDLYHKYTVYLSENERRVGASLSNFLKLRENYENKLYCNKIMEQEIVSVKKRDSLNKEMPKIKPFKEKDDHTWVGPPHPVSNLRLKVFPTSKHLTKEETDFYEKSKEIQEWSQQYWELHNKDFEESKKTYIEKVSKKRKSDMNNLTIEEMADFYKEFLDKNYNKHVSYNWQWYKRNFELLYLSVKAKVSKLRKNGKER